MGTKPKPLDLKRLTERAIEARLQRPPTKREAQWTRAVLKNYRHDFGNDEPSDGFDLERECRRLFWEAEFGMDREWGPYRREDFPDDPGWLAACDRYARAAAGE